MNRSELIERVRTAYTADSSTPSEPEALIDFAIRTAFHEILKALKRGEVVTIRDFGRWEVRERAERDRFNVNSGEVCRSAPRQVIKFAVARSDPLANVRDDPFQQPEKFDSAEHLIGWLTTAADSIKRWDERQRAIAAWKNTESLRSTLLSDDEHRALLTRLRNAVEGFDERVRQAYREFDALEEESQRAQGRLRNAQSRLARMPCGSAVSDAT
jgi:nucleoid DNA-binding protein